MQNKKELYDKASKEIHNCLGLAHMNIVDMCDEAFSPKKCISCKHIVETDHIGSFCGHESRVWDKVSPLVDFCSKHEERK